MVATGSGDSPQTDPVHTNPVTGKPYGAFGFYADPAALAKFQEGYWQPEIAAERVAKPIGAAFIATVLIGGAVYLRSMKNR